MSVFTDFYGRNGLLRTLGYLPPGGSRDRRATADHLPFFSFFSRRKNITLAETAALLKSPGGSRARRATADHTPFFVSFFPAEKKKKPDASTYSSRPDQEPATPCENTRQDTMILSAQFTCGVAKNFLLGRFRRVLLNIIPFSKSPNRKTPVFDNINHMFELCKLL